MHSLKDLPTTPHERITLAGVPTREDPRDAVVARDGLTLGELPAGARIGTGSPRRAAQLLALGLGFDVVAIRGNVDTRIKKVAAGEVDAVVLARAGLARLGRMDEVTEVLDPLQMLPAPGQGALAVECRADDDLAALVRNAIDDPRTRAGVTAERAVLAALEAGCSAPVGALAEIAEGDDGDELWLRAVALSLDGAVAIRTVRDRVAGERGEGRPGAGRGDVGRRGVEAHRGADGMSTSRNKTQPTTSSKKATVSTRTTKTTTTDQDTTRAAAKKTSPARSAAAKTVEAPVRSALPVGFVSFVGSGPGDPELLTVRAVDLLRQAEVVVTETPEHAALVETFCAGAEVVDGGFGQDGQPLTHAGRAKVIVKQARSRHAASCG